MSENRQGRDRYSRRELLRAGAQAGALGILPLAVPAKGFATSRAGAERASQEIKANGDTQPYPIPWLDKNGSHNQPAGLNLEPCHIYHFKGLVARSSTFSGMGTDNKGNRIAFGAPTTDYGVMQGDYWAARTTQHTTITHI